MATNWTIGPCNCLIFMARGLKNLPGKGVRRGVFTLLVLVGVATVVRPQVSPPPEVPPQPRYSPIGPMPAANAPSPLDEPLRLIGEAARSYAGVRDFTCLFIKREQLHGQLQPDNMIAMRLRTEPFSVYLRWLGPAPLVGQEACYVSGRNQGMMRVHPVGVRGALGFISVDPQDPRVMQNSRHTITEAGLGNLIERTRKSWEQERPLNRTQIRVADYLYNKRSCTRVETIHPNSAPGQFYSFRSVFYFDKETHLPIRVEAYDWPRQGGSPQGDLLESYSYIDLRFNVGLDDRAFNY